MGNMVYTVIKIYFRATVFVKCPECGEWGKVVKSSGRRMIKHCNKTTGKQSQCTLQGMDDFKKMIESEHDKYMRKRLCIIQDEIRNGKHSISHNNHEPRANINTRKMPRVWKMGKNWNEKPPRCGRALSR